MKGPVSITRPFLNPRADVNASGGSYGTPLQAAAYRGHADCVNALRRSGAQFRDPGLFRSALQASIEGVQHDIVHISP